MTLFPPSRSHRQPQIVLCDDTVTASPWSMTCLLTRVRCEYGVVTIIGGFRRPSTYLFFKWGLLCASVKGLPRWRSRFRRWVSRLS